MSKKICFVVTVSLAAKNFLQWSFEAFHNAGYDITLICNMDDGYEETLPDYVNAINLPMSRGIDIKGMFSAVSKLKKIFKENKFDIVQYSTPNASLYSSLAAFLARVPVRLYCQWGLVYLGFSGLKGKILKFIERMICFLSTDIQPDSHGNLYFCRENKFYSEKKSRVVWNGSANGVDLEKFDYTKKEQYKKEVYTEFGFNENDKIIGFLGRIGKDKGFNELVLSFKELSQKYENLKLLYVGYNEKPDTVNQDLLKYFSENENIISTNGWVDDPQKYLSAMDVFVFPSYREGFGNVVAEAQAMGIPVVCSDIPGPQNSVIDGQTGFLVPKQNVEKLTEKISQLLDDDDLRKFMAENAINHIINDFDSKKLIVKIIENRDYLLNRTQKKG